MYAIRSYYGLLQFTGSRVDHQVLEPHFRQLGGQGNNAVNVICFHRKRQIVVEGYFAHGIGISIGGGIYQWTLESASGHTSLRITSYNVCYTKLLRFYV